MSRCEYCGREVDWNKTKTWEERHKHLEGVEFKGTIRRYYYGVLEDSDEVCPKCFRKLMIKKIIIRIVTWVYLLCFWLLVLSFSMQEGESAPLIKVIMFILTITYFVSLATAAYNISALYSVVGYILFPFLGTCEMHPFGNEYTIRERREDKSTIRKEQKLKKVKRYLMNKHKLDSFKASLIIDISNIEYELDDNFPKYQNMKTKELASIILNEYSKNRIDSDGIDVPPTAQ